MKFRRPLVIALAALGALGLSASSCEQRGTRDAPIDTAKQDNQAPLIVNMPDGFLNLALKCVGDTLVAAHTRPGAPVLVPASSACAEGQAEALGIPRVREAGK